jgi:hypothetical protein
MYIEKKLLTKLPSIGNNIIWKRRESLENIF